MENVMNAMNIIPAPQALREAARRVEAGEVRYSWLDAGNCNCGIVAQVVTGKCGAQVLDLFHVSIMSRTDLTDWGANDDYGPWGKSSELRCPVTNLPLSDITRILYESGFSLADIGKLELLSDEKVCLRAGLPIVVGSFDNPDAFIRYARALADIIEAREPALTTPQTCEMAEVTP